MTIIYKNKSIIPYFTMSGANMSNFEKVLAEKDQWIGGTCIFDDIRGSKTECYINDMGIKEKDFYLQLGYRLFKSPLIMDGVFDGEKFVFHCLYQGDMILSKRAKPNVGRMV